MLRIASFWVHKGPASWFSWIRAHYVCSSAKSLSQTGIKRGIPCWTEQNMLVRTLPESWSKTVSGYQLRVSMLTQLCCPYLCVIYMRIKIDHWLNMLLRAISIKSEHQIHTLESISSYIILTYDALFRHNCKSKNDLYWLFSPIIVIE